MLSWLSGKEGVGLMTTKMIAEIGCNHKGKMEIAREMIMIAGSVCRVDVVKFQKRNPRELLSQEEYDRPHPNEIFAYGPTYGAHREALEFSKDQHRQLKEWCEEYGVEYSTSVWDVTSAREIIELNPKLIKIPSACNLNRPLLEALAESFAGEIHLSFGMTTHTEEDEIVSFFEKNGRSKNLVLYSCTSGYPVAFEDICLAEITRLKRKFGSTVLAIGFSGHHLGIAADVAASVLGAKFVERHFTLDRTWKGTDHAASLEPDGLRRLARDLRNVSIALEAKQEEILPVEQVQRKKLKTGQIKWTQ
ncbi:MAG: N-acetylneuraminate synthase [Proteobacteria bacterium]|nr:N-acetylneuraminate synthase [Pseudomonadota bacterium]